MQAKVKNKRLSSNKFWKIINRILNRDKPSEPAIINGLEVISFSLDMSKLFAINFTFNATTSAIFYLTYQEYKFTNFSILTWKVSSKALTMKATSPYKMPIIVLKNYNPELSPILSTLFNYS